MTIYDAEPGTTFGRAIEQAKESGAHYLLFNGRIYLASSGDDVLLVLKTARDEIERLKADNQRLKSGLSLPAWSDPTHYPTPAGV